MAEGMVEARLSDPENYAIAVFGGEGQFTIVVGNIGGREREAAYRLLRDEAYRFFGQVEEADVRPGSARGRYDAHVVVKSNRQRVIAFVRERLEASPNQFQLAVATQPSP